MAFSFQFSVLGVWYLVASVSLPLFRNAACAVVLSYIFTFPALVSSSVHRMLAPFPFLAQAPYGFAQAHGQCGNRFKPLFSAAWECAVILPVNFRQQELRVTQNSRERIVEFVTQYLSKIFLRLFEWFVGALGNLLRLAQAAADQA